MQQGEHKLVCIGSHTAGMWMLLSYQGICNICNIMVLKHRGTTEKKNKKTSSSLLIELLQQARFCVSVWGLGFSVR